MNINYFFLLDKSTKKDDKIIFLVVRYKNSRFLLHTKERIEEKYWDAQNKKVKRNYPGASELNHFLEQFMFHVKKNVRIIRAENPNIQFEDLRERVKAIYKDKPVNDFFDTVNLYLDTKKTTTSKSFLHNFNALIKNLKKFEKIKNRKLSFEDITLSFLDDFQNHLITDLKLQNNTVIHKIRFLKMFMKWSVERGYTENRQYEKFTGIKKTESYKFSLNSDDLKAIINAEIDEKLSESRDIFCI
jgi:integrase/recombinase XerD